MNHTQGKPQCCGSVRGDGWGRPHQCARSGTLEHEGKLYCKTHHPPTVKAKDEERSARWRAEWAAEKAASEKKSAEAAEIKSKAAEYDAIKAERDALRAVNAELVEALEGLLKPKNPCALRTPANGGRRQKTKTTTDMSSGPVNSCLNAQTPPAQHSPKPKT